MIRRLSWKLAAIVTLGIAIVHAGFGYLRVGRELSEFEAEARRYHAAMAHALGVAVSSIATRVGTAEAIQLIKDADLETDHAYIRWRNEGAASAPRPPDQMSERMWTVEEADGHIALTSRMPLTLGSERGVLEIREQLTAEEAYVRGSIARTVVLTLVLVVLCCAILVAAGWFLLHRPIEALVAKVGRIGQGDLSGPILLRQDDELGTLGRALNVMCEQLEQLRRTRDRESSARIAALQQLRHADRLTTVGELASGLAHELGTPLNVVSARARMIARRQSEGEEAVDDAQVIVEQAERMAQIIRQLLDFARKRKPMRTDANLIEIVQHTLTILEPLARKTDVQLSLAENSADAAAEVDAAQLQQVLTNLVMNAIQAQPEGGAVRIRVARSSGLPPAGVDGPAAEHLAIEVEDEGEGMPEAVKDRLFEPFFTTKDIGQGTGLGLSVAYGIIQEHGGWIEVDAEPGRGSRFIVHLPRASS